MNKNIHSSLDLSKSLAEFKEKVTKLLEITNISEWSAQTFKDREEKIRNTALNLAGECVAVLLIDLMRNMGEFILTATGERCKILVRERNYILKADRRRLLNYQLVAAHQLPLGSGAVESLIRQAVNLRMKGNSKFWLQNNAEIMLHLQCQWLAHYVSTSLTTGCHTLYNYDR